MLLNIGKPFLMDGSFLKRIDVGRDLGTQGNSLLGVNVVGTTRFKLLLGFR